MFLYYKVTTICCLVTFNGTLNTCTEPFIQNCYKTEPVSTNHRNKSFVIFHQSCAAILLFLALFRYDEMYICNFPLRRRLNRAASKLPREKTTSHPKKESFPDFFPQTKCSKFTSRSEVSNACVLLRDL